MGPVHTSVQLFHYKNGFASAARLKTFELLDDEPYVIVTQLKRLLW